MKKSGKKGAVKASRIQVESSGVTPSINPEKIVHGDPKIIESTDVPGSAKVRLPINDPSNKWLEKETLRRAITLLDNANRENTASEPPPKIVSLPDVKRTVKQADTAENIHGKPVLYRDAKTVLSMTSDFVHKLLCTGPVLNLGDACVYSCVYCYVETVARKLIYDVLGTRAHQDVVVRRRNALEVLKDQLAKNKKKNMHHVVYSSSLVDSRGEVTSIQRLERNHGG